jgi:hypothetical protein
MGQSPRARQRRLQRQSDPWSPTPAGQLRHRAKHRGKGYEVEQSQAGRLESTTWRMVNGSNLTRQTALDRGHIKAGGRGRDNLGRLRRCELVEASLTPSETPDSDPAQIAVDRARTQASAVYLRSFNALSRMRTERLIRYESFDLDQGIANPKEILQSRLLKRRTDGLHKFQSIFQQADAEITRRTQSPEPPTPRNAPCPCEIRREIQTLPRAQLPTSPKPPRIMTQPR